MMSVGATRRGGTSDGEHSSRGDTSPPPRAATPPGVADHMHSIHRTFTSYIPPTSPTSHHITTHPTDTHTTTPHTTWQSEAVQKSVGQREGGAPHTPSAAPHLADSTSHISPDPVPRPEEGSAKGVPASRPHSPPHGHGASVANAEGKTATASQDAAPVRTGTPRTRSTCIAVHDIASGSAPNRPLFWAAGAPTWRGSQHIFA